MAWDHPVPLGRWAALHEPSYWVPMAGIVPKIAASFSLTPESAGELIAMGMAKGEIGHKTVQGDGWIVSPRGAECACQAGFSYEAGLNWATGCLSWPGGRPFPVLIFWPDVERAAQRTAPPTTIEHEPMLLLSAPAKGRPPAKRDAVVVSIQEALQSGVITVEQLGPSGMKQSSLAEMFGTTRPTLRKALSLLQGSPAT